MSPGSGGGFATAENRRSVAPMTRTYQGLVCPRLLGLAVAISAPFLPSPAHAADIGVGLMGAVGGNFQTKPDRKLGDADLNPGFGGLTAGGGLMLDGRVLDGLLGVEVDVLRTSDTGRGTVRLSGPGFAADYKVTIGQSAWHVPILAKITIPSPLVAPMFFLGPELVFPSSSEATLDGPGAPAGIVHSSADSYVMITGGAGVEIKLPLPILDLRIPVGLRVSYNPSLSGSYSDRTKFAANGTTYDSAWQIAVNFTAGAALYF